MTGGSKLSRHAWNLTACWQRSLFYSVETSAASREGIPPNQIHLKLTLLSSSTMVELALKSGYN